MTREQRRLRRQWIAVHSVLAMLLVVLVVVIAWGQEKEEVVPVDPPAVPIEEIKAEIAIRSDHPNRFYYRQEIPLEKERQEMLYNAALEWGVPYELAVAICWRETNFTDLVTPHDGKTYYGMMAVQKESAEYYMNLCGVENLDTEENRLRVGCCILSEHIKNEGGVRAALCRYSNDYEGWYADSVLRKMGDLME